MSSSAAMAAAQSRPNDFHSAAFAETASSSPCYENRTSRSPEAGGTIHRSLQNYLRAEYSDYGDTGFQPSTVIFPIEGCWQVTGTVGDASVTFVTRVVKLAGLKVNANTPPSRVAPGHGSPPREQR